jgi:hypothetical protein
MSNKYLTSKEVAQMLRVSMPTLRRLMREYGDIEECPWLRFGNRYRWDADRLVPWFQYIDACCDLNSVDAVDADV